MILSDRELKGIIEKGAVYVKDGVTPINLSTQLGPSSIDLRLGDKFIIFQNTRMSLLDTKNMKLDGLTTDIYADKNEGIVIHPGQFILGTTMEFLKIPNDMAVRIEGRSSYGRIGIAVHSTAGFCDPGWEGQVTLEIQNLGVVPVKLYPGERVCQAVFHKMTSEAEVPYYMKKDAKYMNQAQTTLSRLEMEKR